MKATQLLSQQHAEVKQLLKRLVDAEPSERRQLFQQVATQLAAHDAIERQIFYPAIEAEMGMTPILGESIVEHGVIEFMLYRADRALEGDEFPFEAKVLSESVLHHVDEEESDLFPSVEKSMTGKRLVDLGEAMRVLFDKELEKDFRLAVHTQLQQVLSGGMKTQARLPRKRASNGSARTAKTRSAREQV